MSEIIKDLQTEISKYYDVLIGLLPKLVVAILVFIVLEILLRLIRKRSMKLIHKKIDDPLLGDFINRFFRVTNITVGILFFLAIVGKSGVVGSILGVAGVSAFVIGFAFKDIGENFLAGIIMAFKRPFRLGDVIETLGITGTIIGLNLRDTQIKTFDGKDVYIPNGQILNNPLFNQTIDGSMRKDFTIRLDFESDIDKAIRILLEVVNSLPGVLKDDKASHVVISELSPSTINLKVRYWVDTFDPIESPLVTHNHAVALSLNALTAAGFNLPGDILELKNYKNSNLSIKPQNKDLDERNNDKPKTA